MHTLIREATAYDFEKVFPLFRQLWPNKELDKEALKTVFERGVHSKTDTLWCLELNNEIIGFCAYAVVNNLWQAGYIAFMYAMVVEEKYRGQGHGSKLIKRSLDDARKQGMKRMELDSAFHREKAHAFYEKLGFEKRAYLFSYPL